jgi:hypothetical protein
MSGCREGVRVVREERRETREGWKRGRGERKG